MTDTFLLTVLTGPNAGASAALNGGRCQIGGGPDDDIILEGVPAGALAIALKDQRLRMQARGAGISLMDGRHAQTLPDGQARIGTLPAMLRLTQDTTVAISRARPDTASRMPLRMAVLLAAVTLGTGLLIGLQIPPGTARLPGLEAQAARLDPIPHPPIQAATGTAPTQITAGALQATSPRLTACIGTCQSDAAEALRTRLAAAGLEGLQVAPSDGVLRVSGVMPADKASHWRELRSQFETDFGRSLPLIVDIANGTDTPALAVASVWLGGNPELRTKTGQTLREGDRTADGWTVNRITSGRISLSRDTRQVDIRY